MNLVVAFTGPEEISAEDADYVRRVVSALDPARVGMFVTGGAVGVDTVVARVAQEQFPDAEHLVIAPGGDECRWNRALRDEGFEVKFGPTRATAGATYMARNEALVRHADVLYAFPRTSQELRRSGTWATVRRAAKLGVPVQMFALANQATAKENDDG